MNKFAVPAGISLMVRRSAAKRKYGMEWDKDKRPPPDICPREYCFHWVVPGGKASPPERRYASSLEALRDSVNWPVWPDGGCACSFGRCIRLDPATGEADYYEPHEWNLERAGLPWFYFATLESLGPEFREQFLCESEALWGSTDNGGTGQDPVPDRPRD
jgi:hypothetical protein